MELVLSSHLCTSTLLLLLPLLSSSLSFPSSHSSLPFSLSKPPSLSSPKSLNSPLPFHYETHFFTQSLDHFSFKPIHPPTFQQRYLLSTEHWAAGSPRIGPIFLYCGNEGSIEWFAQNTGLVWELAPKFGALVLFPEHRYYGESMPFGSQEIAYKDADTLAYLTAEQALADFVILLEDLKRNLSAESSPVVLFGGSYGGMLAAWMRLKYPHVAIGAVASSAPILQFEDIVPADSYYKIASADFKRESFNCFNVIRDSWAVLKAASQQDGGLQHLTSKFQMCRGLNSLEELQEWLFSAYSYLAMVNYPYPAEFIKPLPAYPIREVCKAIDNFKDDTDILSRIFAGISIFYNYTGEIKCFDVDDDIDGINGWDWQACTEMVMPLSSNLNNSMFPPADFDLELYERECLEQYGVRPRPSWIASEFGGHGIKSVLKHFASNIVFSNGLLDPWSGGGVLEDISSSIVALVTEEGAHHLDLRFSTNDDPEWLTEQREVEIAHIKRWLLQYYEDKGFLSAMF